MSKIMVVDDEENIVKIVKTMLESAGHDVITANSGRECLEILKHEKPDLILMDVMMPGMDGWETCRKIKENSETKDIIVSMLTVKSEDEDKVKSFDEAIADWHISKPIRKERLVQTVEWLLKRPFKREE
jgi:two-component system alkaline phosphatase synthesis response regulator PhoP